MVDKSSNSLKPPTRKIFLYSGHEHTVFSTLAALEIYDHHFPKYASATIYELHKLGDKNYAIKVRTTSLIYLWWQVILPLNRGVAGSNPT